MAFPDRQHQKDPVNELFYFDSTALQMVLRQLPDPVVARLTNMCNSGVRGNLFGAITADRGEAVKNLVQREAEPDAEKDLIVNKALVSVVNRLLQERKIKREDRFYCAS